MTNTVLSLASFFKIGARDYQNIAFDANARAIAAWVIWGIGIGIVLLSLYSFYQRRVLGGVLRLLIRENAISEETAKTAAELGLSGKRVLLFAVKHDATLKKMIKTVEGEEERLYLPEEQKYRAEVRFEEKGGAVSLIVTAVLTFGACLLLVKLLPAVLGLFDNLIGK